MGYYCRKLERAFRHLPQRHTLRCHVLLRTGRQRKLYVQFAGYREGDFIETYDFQTKEWRMFMFYVPFAEILLAR